MIQQEKFKKHKRRSSTDWFISVFAIITRSGLQTELKMYGSS